MITLDFEFFTQLIGVIAFALSGAILAINKNLDILGVIIIGIVTAFGGGLTRDLVLGVHPPNVFWNREYIFLVGIAVITTIACFLVAYCGKRTVFMLHKERNVFLLDIADAIGLASFCIAGSMYALSLGHDGKVLLLFVGCITGVGGGIIRDLVLGEIPLVFRKNVYLTPSILGTLAFVLLQPHISNFLAGSIGFIIILTIRVLGIIFKWNLPTVNNEETKEENLNGGDKNSD